MFYVLFYLLVLFCIFEFEPILDSFSFSFNFGQTMVYIFVFFALDD